MSEADKIGDLADYLESVLNKKDCDPLGHAVKTELRYLTDSVQMLTQELRAMRECFEPHIVEMIEVPEALDS